MGKEMKGKKGQYNHGKKSFYNTYYEYNHRNLYVFDINKNINRSPAEWLQLKMLRDLEII